LLVYYDFGEHVLGEQISTASQLYSLRIGRNPEFKYFAVARPEGPAPIMATLLMAPGVKCIIVNEGHWQTIIPGHARFIVGCSKEVSSRTSMTVTDIACAHPEEGILVAHVA
jgi:hypothetical protein